MGAHAAVYCVHSNSFAIGCSAVADTAVGAILDAANGSSGSGGGGGGGNSTITAAVAAASPSAAVQSAPAYTASGIVSGTALAPAPTPVAAVVYSVHSFGLAFSFLLAQQGLAMTLSLCMLCARKRRSRRGGAQAKA